MIPVKIISKVVIPNINEDVISNLIKAEILKDNPTLEISNISFERKLNPNRIVATVDAQLAGSVQEETPAPEETPVSEENQAVPAPEVNETPEPEAKPKRKKVFG
jgi:hypothetical protein